MGNEQIEFMEEISKAPIIVQIFMVTICAIFVVMLLSKKINDVIQWLLLASGLALIQNAGYLLLLQSKNLNEASIALKAEYIGAAYVSTVSLLFVLGYCNKKLPRVVIWGLMGIDTCMLLGVWLWEYTTLYYTSVEYRVIGGTVKLVLGRGILYYIGVCKIVLELLFCMFVSVRELLNARTKIMKTKYVLLISALFFPNLAYVGLVFGILKAYDTVPASTAVTCGILFLGVVYLHVFEDIYVAYADIVRQMKEPVVIMNKEYHFIGANKSAKALVPQICELEHGDSIIKEHIIDDDLARKLVHQEECELELNGRVFDVSVNDVVVDGKLRGYYLLLVDLTRERQHTLKMQQLKEEADKANQAKTAFLSNMSHELRTPINAITGMNEMVMRNSETPEILEYSQNIQFASKTLLSIVNDILDLSKIECGKMELTAGEYKLKQLLYDCYMMVSSRAGAKGLEMIVKSNGKLPSVLYGDELRIRQIIINLLTNAVKYTENGSVTLQFDGHVIEDEMLQLEVSVKDTGIGVKEENIDKLFDIFQRMDLKKNKAIEGTGLGLAITKQFVDLMGGTISVQSTYGAGSCFTVKLPQKIIDSHPMGDFYSGDIGGQNKKKNYQKQFEAPDASALVVDDVEVNLMVIKGLLKETKLQIDTARSGQECLQKVKEKRYDIILMDHMMPEMDGVETLQCLRELEDCLNIHTPVIALTANAIMGVREMYLQAGFADYLSKPVEESALESMIIKYLPKEKRHLTGEDNAENKGELTMIEKLKQLIPEIDILAGMGYCGNDEDIYRIAMESYCEQDFSENLSVYFQEKDLKNYQILIHGVKSSSLSIGLCDLSEQAKQLEAACKDNNWAYVEENHAKVYEKYVDVVKTLKSILF